VFRKTREEAAAGAATVGLPEERKTLAERYTIDAQEAESRAHRAAEEERKREPGQARGVAAPRARPEVRERSRPVAQVQVRRDPATEEPIGALRPAANAFPIYGWLQQAAPAPGETNDWTRALLKTQEEKERGETPLVRAPDALRDGMTRSS
jgi:hypothetical protein